MRRARFCRVLVDQDESCGRQMPCSEHPPAFPRRVAGASTCELADGGARVEFVEDGRGEGGLVEVRRPGQSVCLSLEEARALARWVDEEVGS